MREYQKTYVENLKRIITLNDPDRQQAGDGEGFFALRRERSRQVHALIRENSAMLRRELFPVLDDIASADDEEIGHLSDFAAALGAGGMDQLDLILNYSIHNALVVHARKRNKRDMLIRELYQTGLALFYMQEIINRSGKNRYQWKMGLMFGEAASYIKQYDDITDPETRGYIHRSMGNLSLAYGGANMDDAKRKMAAVRRSLQVLTDPMYREKTPSLPWDRYVYVSHQERSSALNVLRAGYSDPQVVREIMESAEFVREYQAEMCRQTGAKPMVRWRMGYEAAQYHCGIRPLSYLLHWLEQAFFERDQEDYSEDGVYNNITIPALYAEYLARSEEYRSAKKNVLLHMYRQVERYVRSAAESQVGEQLSKELLVCLQSFVEYPSGIQAKDFLLRLVMGRDADAYVHSRLIAQIAEMMTARAIDVRPEVLVGALGCPDADQVKANAQALRRFAYDSGLLHDVGLLAFPGLTRHIGRSWLEDEEEMYRHHVYVGEALLVQSPSTRPYAPVALGHHRFYDGSGGYPPEYDRSAQRDQPIIDIIAVANYFVRSTDQLSSINYSAYSCDQALAAIADLSGTRFSPQAVALLLELAPDIRAYLDHGVQEAYAEAFRLMV